MPTYEYRCKACGHELEIVQAFSDAPLATCPSCGAEQLRKVFGAVGISFKGSGFYKTDSRSSSTSSSTSSTSSSGSGDGSSSPKGDGAGSSSSDTSSPSPSTSSETKSA